MKGGWKSNKHWTKYYHSFNDEFMEDFDNMKYNFVNDDYEDGHDTFQRIMGVDGNATNITRRTEGGET